MSWWGAMSIGLALVVLVTIADYALGPTVTLPILYVLPVALVAWLGSASVGLVIALAASLASLASDVSLNRGNPAAIAVSAVARAWIYVLIVLLLSSLKASWQRERLLARRDELTGIANRREFFEAAERELVRSRRTDAPMTVLYLDIDDFKRVNDLYGHAVGDEVLRCVASTLTVETRASDFVARLGGDEFVILTVDPSSDGTRRLTERIGDAMAAAFDARHWDVTISVGATTFVRPPVSVDAMLGHADRTMYGVKRSGKRAVVHEVLGDEPGPAGRTRGPAPRRRERAPDPP